MLFGKRTYSCSRAQHYQVESTRLFAIVLASALCGTSNDGSALANTIIQKTTGYVPWYIEFTAVNARSILSEIWPASTPHPTIHSSRPTILRSKFGPHGKCCS